MVYPCAVINMAHFKHNIRFLQEKVDHRPMCLAVKANAYGHGAVHIVQEAEKLGLRYFGVSRIIEAQELRLAGIRSHIILFTLAGKEELEDIWEYNLQPFVSDIDYFQDLVDVWEKKRPPFPLRVHIKTDTGMGRIGCSIADVLALALKIRAHEGFILEGIATHYPLSASPENDFTRTQYVALQEVSRMLARQNLSPQYYHAANSGGILYYTHDGLDIVRPGIAAYGYLPQGGESPLLPVMELRAEVSMVKKIPPNTAISYGHTWKSKEECWVATLNIGYADGYPRILSNKAKVLINGACYSQVGNICMDQCMVNLGKAKNHGVKRYDEAIMFGHNCRGESADSLARKANTISYEITSCINSRVPRLYL